MRNKLIWISVFGVAMAFMEASVVVYLREIYYPKGFSFPLTEISYEIMYVEILREAATIIMLISIAALTGKTFSQKFSWFIYCFAIWDIFYYVFLYLTLSWPESLLTWDILFLIPVPWTGPVIAPVINSLTMILLALIILNASEKQKVIIRPTEWTLLIIGTFIIIFSYTLDYFTYNVENKSLESFNEYIPVWFNWYVYFIGMIPILFSTILIFRRYR